MRERVNVVRAIARAFSDERPAPLPGDATPAERWAAEPLLHGRLAQASEPVREAALILFYSYRAGDSWADVFDRLSPDQANRVNDHHRHRLPATSGRPPRSTRSRPPHPAAVAHHQPRATGTAAAPPNTAHRDRVTCLPCRRARSRPAHRDPAPGGETCGPAAQTPDGDTSHSSDQ